jgi:hypothetical protein
MKVKYLKLEFVGRENFFLNGGNFVTDCLKGPMHEQMYCSIIQMHARLRQAEKDRKKTGRLREGKRQGVGGKKKTGN